MPATTVIDLTDPDSDYALGDTHFTYEQIAAETGYAISTIRTHARRGPLKGCARMRIPSTTHGPPRVAIEYDAALHAYLQQ